MNNEIQCECANGDGEEVYARYERAQAIIQGLFTSKVVRNQVVHPTWVRGGDCFLYSRETNAGFEFRLVNAETQENKIAFDHSSVAKAVAIATKCEVCADNLPLTDIDYDLDRDEIIFDAFGKRWELCLSNMNCQAVGDARNRYEIVAPNGKIVCFSRDWNLWLRDINTGEETQLTSDGEEDFDYGAASTAWAQTMWGSGLEVEWSSDSKKIFTLQRDLRGVKALPVMHHVPNNGSTRPFVEYHKFSYPGDDRCEELQLLAIDIETGFCQRACHSAIPVTRNNHGYFSANLGWWHGDSRRAYFVDVDRYYKYARLYEFDTTTGKTKLLFEETSETQVDLMNNGDMWPSYFVLSDTNELLWYSARSGWAHLYLYDLDTGALKNTVTSGDWLIRDVITVNEETREVFVQTGGRTEGRNPYYRDVLRVNIDTSEVCVLVATDHDYYASGYTDLMWTALPREQKNRGVSPSGEYVLITRSRVNEMPVSMVVSRDGEELFDIETAEYANPNLHWRWPEPVRTIASDGVTELCGVIYKPSDFDENKAYPVISNICNTPDFPWAAHGAFGNQLFMGVNYYDGASLAELGFIVVQLDGRGAGFRSKAFKDIGYGNLQLPVMLEDQVAGLKQLADRYPYMDLNRVGVAAHIGGGPGVVQAMLDYPELFKVGVAGLYHDSRLMTSLMWGDMFEGREREAQRFPEEKVEALKGKLLFLGGMLDTTNPPAGVFRVVEALQKANKDFDMILLPNMGHTFSNYLLRRTWDYFVEHLLGEVPPEEFNLSTSLDAGMGL